MRAARLFIHPDYQDKLAGFTEAEHFLGLREQVVSGHPDRQVSRVHLGEVVAYLKREHRVPWSERARNLWAGFGPASKSWREAEFLRRLRPTFAGCPELIAAGELADGRAFVLLREVAGALSLPEFLEAHQDPSVRRAVAVTLGRELARLHALGIVHGDLYANHVLVDPTSLAIVFLDWQRAGFRHRGRWRDLATLAATLPPGICSRGDRLACLKAYLGDPGAARKSLHAVERELSGLRGRRHVRVRTSGLEPDAQSLLCLQGDGLRVTPAFCRTWLGNPPDFLVSVVEQDREIDLPDGARGRLVCRHHTLPWLRRRGAARRTWASPERLQMNLLNRLERCGIEGPRVLAEGERPLADGRIAGLLLTQLPDARPLEDWLASDRDVAERLAVLREAAQLLARLHEAGCFFLGPIRGLGVGERVVLLDASDLTVRRRWRGFWRRLDLHRLLRLAQTEQEHAGIREGYRSSSTLAEAAR